LRWYQSLFADKALLNAAKLSFLIAALTATASSPPARSPT